MSAILSPKAYIEVLHLDEDMIEDVQQEINDATEAWISGVGSNETILASAMDGDESTIAIIMRKLGTTFCEEDHGVELKAVVKDGILSKNAFIDWYVRWVFKSDDDHHHGDDNDDNDNDSQGIGNEKSNKGWSGISWSVAPSSEAKEGETWKCPNCRIINKWTQMKCLACDSDAPHASTLPKPTVSFSSSKSSSTSTGFSFGGAPAATTTTGFSFSGAPLASSNSTTGSSVPAINVFTFGTTTVTAPSKSSET